MPLRYVLITPARNEEAFIALTIIKIWGHWFGRKLST